MKLRELLIVTCCSIIAARGSEIEETEQEALLRRASEQLERLAPYRRIGANAEASGDLSDLPETWRSQVDQNDLDETRTNDRQGGVPWEVVEILPEQTESSDDAAKRVDDEKRITIGVIADPKYAAMMQERIKRGFDAGSASLLTSIAGGVLNGIVSTSSGSAAQASASSSQTAHKTAYGPPSAYGHDEKHFGPWDFKKAIFSTLFQAIKAIGGGVLALKGQLVKGSSYLLSAKAGVVSKTGDAITSFGKQLASSVTTPPKHYPPETYVYHHHPSVENIGHDVNYEGPPPNLDDYSEANDYASHTMYGVPSNDNDQGGLLIVMPTKSEHPNEHAEQLANAAAPPEKPDLTKLEESFGGPASGSVVKDFLSSVPLGSAGVPSKDHQEIVSQDHHHAGYDVDHNVGNNVDSYHPTQTYGAPDYQPSHGNSAQNYESYGQNVAVYQQQPEAPQTTSYNSQQSHSHHFPDGHLFVQPSVEPYPPLHVQQHIEYPPSHHPSPDALGVGAPLTSHQDDGMSVYASLTVDTEPQHAPLKIPSGYLGGLYDPPGLQPHADFHGPYQFGQGLYHGGGGGGLTDGPLKIHLLDQLSPTHYWRAFAPASPFGAFNSFRKRDVPQRRTLTGWLARYSSSLRSMTPRRL